MKKTSFTIPIAIILGGVIVAVAVYITERHVAPSVSTGNPALVRPVTTSDHILGDPAAPVKIIEYADFDCDYCKTFDQTLEQIVSDQGLPAAKQDANGQVAVVFREFPLTEIHPDAMKLAEAAECAAVAGGNDAFWKFADELYAHQPADPSDFGTLAAQAGVPGDAFASCYQNASSTVAARIEADRQNALDTGAHGTPYSLILAPNQPPIVMSGAYSYDAVKALISQALGH